MRKTDTDGKRVADGGRPVKMPAKRKPAGMNRNLIVLIVSVVVVSVLVVVMSLIRAHTSENENDTALPDSGQIRTETADTGTDDVAPTDTDRNDEDLTDIDSDDSEPSYVDRNDAEVKNAESDDSKPLAVDPKTPDGDLIDTKLLGTWSFNGEATYSFDEENMGRLDIGNAQYTYTYKVLSDHRVMLDYEDEAVEDAEYQYSVKGDHLTLKGGEGTTGGTYKLSRVN